MRGLTRRFGALTALDGVDLDVRPASIHGIIGPNGSGKTTLFDCMTGLLKADSGSVHLDERDITGAAARIIASLGVRRTFQGGALVSSMTVIGNVMTGADQSVGRSLREAFLRPPFAPARPERRLREEALAALTRVGMADSAERWASDLAWAERQLVQIARALAAHPRRVLLDEPASGMGAMEAERVAAIVRAIREDGATVVLVSHDVKLTSELCDTVTVLNFGKKIAEGSPDEVRGDHGVREAYLGVQ